jgi:redox-sensitive bicupin YhaK (pirin superfamily)
MHLEPWALPQDADVRPHPHIGLVAVTYLIDGYVTHRDSLGNVQELTPGSVACTVAGEGIVHSERLDRLRLEGGALHMFQILLALADDSEDRAPAFLYVEPGEVPIEATDGATIRRLVGSGSAVEGQLGTPAFLSDVTLEPGARFDPPSGPAERAVYVASGAVTVDGESVATARRAVLGPGPATVQAGAEGARLLVLGGPTMGPRYFWWNYLHSSLDTVEAAKAAWRNGEVPRPPGDTESFTPAPSDEGRPLRRLNAPA